MNVDGCVSIPSQQTQNQCQDASQAADENNRNAANQYAAQRTTCSPARTIQTSSIDMLRAEVPGD